MMISEAMTMMIWSEKICFVSFVTRSRNCAMLRHTNTAVKSNFLPLPLVSCLKAAKDTMAVLIYLELQYRYSFLAVLQYFRVVDRKLGAWLVVVDVIDAHVDLSDGAARHGAVVAGHDGEPVEGF